MDEIQKTAEQIMVEGLRHRQLALEIHGLGQKVGAMMKTADHRLNRLKKSTSWNGTGPDGDDVVDYLREQHVLLSRLATDIKTLRRV
jgi:hypothetical protein